MSEKNRPFKSNKTVLLSWDFCRSRISAGFGKRAGFRLEPEPEPKFGTALAWSHLWISVLTLQMLTTFHFKLKCIVSTPPANST